MKGSNVGRRPNGASSIYKGGDGRWHGRVTVGVRDDGTPDRRHVQAKTEAAVTRKVRDLERQRDDGLVLRTGQRWTVAEWLDYWAENIAAPTVRENTIAGYRVAIRKHLIPGVGAHRLAKLRPEHLERLYVRMQASGSAPATAHQAHRTIRTALGEAVRRGYLTQNPAALAKPPRVVEEEIEPYSVDEIHRLMTEANGRRNSARWWVALVLGLRQGEVLGLRWDDLDLEGGTLRVRRGRVRPRYSHGCGGTCGRRPGYCRQRRKIRPDTEDTKSVAGRRRIGLPASLIPILREHREAQDRERATAGQLWHDGGWVFATPTGEPVNPNTDYHHWKRLLREAGLREARLHDARHTAATGLLILDVTNRAAMGVMGWSSASMAKRYQHLTDPVLHGIAERLDGLIWKPPDSPPGASDDEPDDGAAGVPAVA